MTLFVILFALFATRQAMVPDYFKQLQWGHQYLALFKRWSLLQRLHPVVRYGFFVVPPMFVCWLLGFLHYSWFIHAIDFVIGFMLLISIIGDRQLESAMLPFLKRWCAQEWQAAYTHGKSLFHYHKINQPSDIINQTLTLFFLRMNQVLFSPIFWYALFGSAGLVVYLLTYVAAQSPVEVLNGALSAGNKPDKGKSFNKITSELLQVLDGFSSRLISLSIALLCFNRKAFVVVFRRFRVTDREAEIVLKLAIKSGLDFHELPSDQEPLAIEGSRRIHALKELKNNMLILWLIIVAVLSLFGFALGVR